MVIYGRYFMIFMVLLGLEIITHFTFQAGQAQQAFAHSATNVSPRLQRIPTPKKKTGDGTGATWGGKYHSDILVGGPGPPL